MLWGAIIAVSSLHFFLSLPVTVLLPGCFWAQDTLRDSSWLLDGEGFFLPPIGFHTCLLVCSQLVSLFLYQKKYVFTFFLNSKNSKKSKKNESPKKKEMEFKKFKKIKKICIHFFLNFLNSISFFLVYRLTSRDFPERGIISIKSFRHANVQIVHKGPSYIYIYIYIFIYL